ncbi:MAG: carboxypeptidase-like regulatory domain-containing protein [Bacteroidota bacterium]|nr:carboxypeptidase-like regulatory domain-containing protein [Bacteroidota bacterium]|tara:strand:+ start:116 stop:838 length:723 start_codon:yes stop_codon:yes gene_type:complete
MKKKLLFLFLLFQFGYSQDRQLIQGKVIYRNINVVAANVINNTSQSTTITDDLGEFQIYAKEGDEIIFSSVQYIIRTVRITDEIIKNKRLTIQINERIRELDEVVITPDNTEKFLDLKEEEFKGFDYVADKSTKVENPLTETRELRYGVDFVNIFKLLKTIIDSKSEEEKENLIASEVIPYLFEDDFFTENLLLASSQINDFLIYIDTRPNVIDVLLEKNQFLLIDFLLNESIRYKEINE